MFRHIIFDCFGTLIDTGSGSVEAARRILEDVGCDADPVRWYAEWKDVKRRMMREEPFDTEQEMFCRSLGEMFIRYGIHADPYEHIAPMTDTLYGRRELFPDTIAALDALDAAGTDHVIGSVTDNAPILHFMEADGLSRYFPRERIFTSEDLRAYKPDPAFYTAIVTKMGWDVSDCLFVGDSITDDVLGPHTVGMRAALIDRSGTYTGDMVPDYILRSLRELTGLEYLSR